MPIPPPDEVTELIAGVVTDAGCDLETVTVSAAGRRSVVRVVVDSAAGLELDEVAALSRSMSTVLDAAPAMGNTAYTLEVSTPGVDRPLTEERHWRRARGRRVALTLEQERVSGRVGAVGDGMVQLVLSARPEPDIRMVAIAEVRGAVVEVEFAPPDPAELAVTGAPRGSAPEVPTPDVAEGVLDNEENK